MLISICDWLFICVPSSFGEMFIKLAHIQSYWYLWYYVNKTRLEFHSSNFKRFALSKDVCLFFAILISKSVPPAGNFWYTTGVFYLEVSRTLWNETERNEMRWNETGKSVLCEIKKSVLCEMRKSVLCKRKICSLRYEICTLRNENNICEM